MCDTSSSQVKIIVIFINKWGFDIGLKTLQMMEWDRIPNEEKENRVE